MLKVLVGYPSAAEEFVVVERQVGRPVRTERVLDPDTLRDSRGRSTRSTSTRRSSTTPSGSRPRPGSRPAVGLPTTSPASSPSARAHARRSTWSWPPSALAFLRGRDYALPDDVRDLALDVLRHRLVLSYEALAEDLSADDLLLPIIEAVPRPTSVAARTRAVMDPTADPESRAAAPATRVAGRPATRRPAAGRLPHACSAGRGSTSRTCASTSPATTCDTSSGTSPHGWTRRSSASTSRTARSRPGSCSTVPVDGLRAGRPGRRALVRRRGGHDDRPRAVARWQPGRRGPLRHGGAHGHPAGEWPKPGPAHREGAAGQPSETGDRKRHRPRCALPRDSRAGPPPVARRRRLRLHQRRGLGAPAGPARPPP